MSSVSTYLLNAFSSTIHHSSRCPLTTMANSRGILDLLGLHFHNWMYIGACLFVYSEGERRKEVGTREWIWDLDMKKEEKRDG